MICSPEAIKSKDISIDVVLSEQRVGLRCHQYTLPINGYSIAYFNSIDEIHEIWDFVSNDDIFLSSKYLKAIEVNPMEGFKFIYGLIFEGEHPVAITYFQIKHLKLRNSLRIESSYNSSIIGNISTTLKQLVASTVNFDTLICGNTMLTGPYGYYFSDNTPYPKQFNLVEAAIDLLVEILNERGEKINIILSKDYYIEKKLSPATLESSNFTEFSVQPNMLLFLDPGWNDFEDYIGSFKSKYRVRAKKAFEKIRPLKKRRLTLEDLEKYKDQIYDLYLDVAKAAGFNLFLLPKAYFYGMKKAFPEKFVVSGYFDQERLLGFYSYFISDYNLDAHFLGYDNASNRNYQIYLNMLFDMVFVGIQNECRTIRFSRTALEIKSSVGAQAMDMLCYLKHKKSITNKIVPRFLKLFTPEINWTPRTPFR